MTLGSTRLQVEPGGQVQFPVSIRNQSQLVESFRMDLVGLDPDWWQVEPPDLAVYPGREDSVLVVLRPPVQVEIPEGAIPSGFELVRAGTRRAAWWRRVSLRSAGCWTCRPRSSR